MARKKAEKAQAKAQDVAASANPYVQKVINDEDIRDNAVVAFEAARDAYARLSGSKQLPKAIVEDKKLHKDLVRSADALKAAAAALKEPPKKQKSGGLGKLIAIAVVGAIVAVVASEGLRNKVLDALFGAEEEFDYTSSATPSPVPPAQPVA